MSTPLSDALPRRRRFTLHGDGSSDLTLQFILGWLLKQLDPQGVWEPQWADLSRLRRRPGSLADRLRLAVDLYPCDALFVHRDQESGSTAERLEEIAVAAADLRVPYVPLVPVRMTEAWLLFDEPAIRKASGNPRGDMPLALPHLSALESEPDPKEKLFAAIRRASGLSGRRLDKLRPPIIRHRLAEIIEDYSPLRRLPAFSAFEQSTRAMLVGLVREASGNGS